MRQNFSSNKLPTVGASSSVGGAPAWSNPSRITADDGSSAAWAAVAGGQQSLIVGSAFAFPQLPDEAVIDGIQVNIDGAQFSAFGNVTLNVSGSTSKAIGALNTSYGSSTDLWGLSVITKAQIAALTVSVSASDISGGDATASIDHFSVTVFWHIEVENTPANVPTRVEYKVYSRGGKYLGLLPDVSSKFGFSQDINSAGSTIQITCGKFIETETTVEALQDNNGDPIQTESSNSIMASSTGSIIARGATDDEVLFKNSNRIKVWVYNQWYPNGKLMFSGQVNRVSFQIGGGDTAVRLLVYSDGLDLGNYIARGYPFAYTNDQQQSSQNSAFTVDAAVGWNRCGQLFKSGAPANNMGAIDLYINGTADVTINFYDGVVGNFLGSTTKSVATGGPAVVSFEFAQLIPISPLTNYFFTVSVPSGQSVIVYYQNTASSYANGAMYSSNYAGGSGGGAYAEVTGDLYFTTKYGVPTTTTTYTSDDPVADMAHGILLDYNARGGFITERDFQATGLSLTYTFNSASIFDALKKILEMSPTNYWSYIDLGTAEMDIQPTSTTPDFTIVFGKDISQLNLALSIEQVKNYLLLSGGEVTPGVNLFRDYQDTESSGFYGLRTGTKGDNRITLTPTADAIGSTFIEENSDEQQETSVLVLNDMVDITLLTPGKTIGFKNGGSFLDAMVLQIARRDYSPQAANLTLGRLPLNMNAEVQRINRELEFEQTINNPTAPS